MGRSVAVRLTLWYMAAMALVLAGVSAAADAVLAGRLRDRLDSSLRSALHVMSVSLRHELEENDGKQIGEIWFRSLLGTLHQVSFSHSGVAVFQGDRRVAAAPGPHGYIPEMSADLATGAVPLFRNLHFDGRRYRVVAAGVPVPAVQAMYTVVVGESLEANEAAVNGFRALLLVIVPGVLLLTGAGAFLLVRRTLTPVLAMSTTVDSITAKDLQQRVLIANPHDELGRLAATFNRLLERLHASFEQQLRFMADASHELRTPVSIIRTAAEVALESPAAGPQDGRETLRLIQAQATRLSRLVNDMLLLARADAGVFPMRKEDFYLDELVQDSARAVRVLADRRGVTVEAMADGEALCHADEGLLRQLLLILLDNAVKHTPAGGSVRVTLGGGPGGFDLEVSDTGTGIPLEAQPHIFERFYRADTARTHRDGAGAGLGLAIARSIAEAHGGSLELAGSGPGGSTFLLRLPHETPCTAPAPSFTSV